MKYLSLLALAILCSCEAENVVSSQSPSSSGALSSSVSNQVVVSQDTCYKEYKADSTVAIGYCAIDNGQLVAQLFDTCVLSSQSKAVCSGTEGIWMRKTVTIKTTWVKALWLLGEE